MQTKYHLNHIICIFLSDKKYSPGRFTFEMKFQNRNILLFFEENEDKNNISSNLVRLFMNRFVIEEEKRYEIIGTFNLSKVSHSGTSPDRQSNNLL